MGPDQVADPVAAAHQLVDDGQMWVHVTGCGGGNYSDVRPLVWARADTVVWLDYPLALCFYRLCRRTWARVQTQEELWGGNRESWRTQLLTRDSLLLYTLRTHRRRRRELAAQLADPAYAHLTLVRLRSPRAAERWLEEFVQGG